MQKPMPKPAGGSGSNMTKIFDQTLAADSFTIDTGVAIPAGAVALDVFLWSRTDEASNPGQLWLQFNGDTGANYQWIRTGGSNATSITSVQPTDNGLAILTSSGGSTLPNVWGATRMTIPNYDQTTMPKSAIWTDGYSNDRAFLRNGLWTNTAAINRIVVVCLTGTQKLKAGSRMAVFTVA